MIRSAITITKSTEDWSIISHHNEDQQKHQWSIHLEYKVGSGWQKPLSSEGSRCDQLLCFSESWHWIREGSLWISINAALNLTWIHLISKDGRLEKKALYLVQYYKNLIWCSEDLKWTHQKKQQHSFHDNWIQRDLRKKIVDCSGNYISHQHASAKREGKKQHHQSWQ